MLLRYGLKQKLLYLWWSNSDLIKTSHVCFENTRVLSIHCDLTSIGSSEINVVVLAQLNPQVHSVDISPSGYKEYFRIYRVL